MTIDEARKLSDEGIASSRRVHAKQRAAARRLADMNPGVPSVYTATLVLIARGERPRESSVLILAAKLRQAVEVTVEANRATDRHANMAQPTERGEDAAG